jgi:hypothetical protein
MSEIQQIKYFFSFLLMLFPVFAFVIVFFGFFDLLNIFSLESIFSERDTSYVYANDAMPYDYNFALLPIFFGIIIFFKNLLRCDSRFAKIFNSILLAVFSTHIFFSGSNRGFILLGALYSILLITSILQLIEKDSLKKWPLSGLGYFFLILFLLIFLHKIYFFHTSSKFKNKAFYCIGTRDQNIVRDRIASNLYKTLHFFNKKVSYDSLHKKIWNPVYDSRDPYSGWGKGVFKTEFDLAGNNSEIIPPGSIGYRLDSTCKGSGDSNYTYFANLIKEAIINDGDTLCASVYCFVSDDFDGNVVALETDKPACGRKTIEYDYSMKGTWQKLNLKVACSSGNAPVYFYINKIGASDFLSLKGYVIYAYPEYKIISKNKTLSSYLITPINNGDFRLFSEKPHRGIFYPVQQFSKSGFSTSDLNLGSIKSSLIFQKIVPVLSNVGEKDLIRRWVSGLLREDTVYHGHKNKLNISISKEVNKDDRLEKWKFGWQIYLNEYDLKQKTFGGGFNFLNWYGYYFLNDKTKTDWPHNPFLHILLYSGIIGLIFYFILLYKVFFIYINYLKEYHLFFVFFIITYFFTFFSGSNPFDPPIMGFFMILPFFIHSIYRNQINQRT